MNLIPGFQYYPRTNIYVYLADRNFSLHIEEEGYFVLYYSKNELQTECFFSLDSAIARIKNEHSLN